ncbi:hypothetical protein F5B21DRAFT_462601 [Xylaria acuta]|nr:hypothetical protein F5B21DRAFT_462601 [Xylaria acuta]
MNTPPRFRPFLLVVLPHCFAVYDAVYSALANPCTFSKRQAESSPVRLGSQHLKYTHCVIIYPSSRKRLKDSFVIGMTDQEVRGCGRHQSWIRNAVLIGYIRPVRLENGYAV